MKTISCRDIQRISPQLKNAPEHLELNEEVFEWVALLEAISAARSKFRFVELGAGYGRWSAAAIKCATANDLDATALLVEAEPEHASRIPAYMRSQGVDDDRYTILEAAVGAAAGEQPFVVIGPHGMPPTEWYGQALSAPIGMRDFAPPTKPQAYFGHPVLLNPAGWGAIRVKMRQLRDILPEEGIVDLIDMDVQGAEASIVEADVDALSASVCRLYIGTHSNEVERRLSTCLRDAGWRAVWMYPCSSKARATEFGLIDFGDGVQYWTNPRLAR